MSKKIQVKETEIPETVKMQPKNITNERELTEGNKKRTTDYRLYSE